MHMISNLHVHFNFESDLFYFRHPRDSNINTNLRGYPSNSKICNYLILQLFSFCVKSVSVQTLSHLWISTFFFKAQLGRLVNVKKS